MARGHWKEMSMATNSWVTPGAPAGSGGWRRRAARPAAARQSVQQGGQCGGDAPQVGPQPRVDRADDDRVAPQVVVVERRQRPALDPVLGVEAKAESERHGGAGEDVRGAAQRGEATEGVRCADEHFEVPGRVAERIDVLHPHQQPVVAQVGDLIQPRDPQSHWQPAGERRVPGTEFVAPREHVGERARTSAAIRCRRGQCRTCWSSLTKIDQLRPPTVRPRTRIRAPVAEILTHRPRPRHASHPARSAYRTRPSRRPVHPVPTAQQSWRAPRYSKAT